MKISMKIISNINLIVLIDLILSLSLIIKQKYT